MEAERPIPQPITPESKPYWDGMKEGKLMLPKCQDCGKVHLSARVLPALPFQKPDLGQGSGKGKLYSFEILYRPFNRAVKVPPPYVLAMVELEEGPRMLSNLVNVEPDPKVIKCDMPVEIVFSKLTDDVTIPLFQPAR